MPARKRPRALPPRARLPRRLWLVELYTGYDQYNRHTTYRTVAVCRTRKQAERAEARFHKENGVWTQGYIIRPVVTRGA